MRKPPRYNAGLTALVVNKDEPKTLQDFLALKYALSRRTAKAVVDGRNVWVNRKCVWMARFAIKTGDIVEIPTAVLKGAQRQSSKNATAVGKGPLDADGRREERRNVRVLWSDEYYVVCDKPAGFLSCDDPSSVESILREQESLPNLEAVHRLDRDTTGCLLFAKNHSSLVAAVEMFKTHKVTKLYHAISAGNFEFSRKIITQKLDDQDAKSFVTREISTPDASFLRVRIETGRTNQIRRHLSSIRHPILGDRVYGLKNARDPRMMQVPRQMLHASSLSLPHPIDRKKEISVHSPLPADFRSTLKMFGMGKKR
jgi:23S rRNA pseudouridine1911/1915/1917 synthase